MGIGCSRGLLNSFGWNRPRHIEQRQTYVQLTMLDAWMNNDALFDVVRSIRYMMHNAPIWSILCTISKFIPCQVKMCRCRGGIYNGPAWDSRGWKNGVCTNIGCKHLISDHMFNLTSESKVEFTTLVQVVFDLINLLGTLDNEKLRDKSDRNFVLEEVFNSVQYELKKSLIRRSFTSFNINNIYGIPPFENTNIEQILLNLCMHIAGNRKTELKHFLMVTKFILVYFDTWLWPSNELPACDSLNYCKDYFYYYQRFLVFCYLPRCVHSMSPRYSPSKIFGRDVLRYTLREFRTKLSNWCAQESSVWTDHTKFYCLEYFAIYMDELEKEVYAEKSPIWTKAYEVYHFQTILYKPILI